MTKVFIGGSRRVTRLSADVQRRIDRIIEKGLAVIVGDANGVDKSVQRYLNKRGYNKVEVFCTSDHCRNNIGNWPLRMIATRSRAKDFQYYALKDRVMANEASVGFMIWDGKSLGTLLNIFRLMLHQKHVVVYTVPSKSFSELKNGRDWGLFVSHCPNELRKRVELEAAQEQPIQRNNRQASFF